MCAGEALEIGSEHEPTLSVGGRLRFGEVQYEDGGEYKCTARHPLSGEEESHTLRLRVRGERHVNTDLILNLCVCVCVCVFCECTVRIIIMYVVCTCMYTSIHTVCTL